MDEHEARKDGFPLEEPDPKPSSAAVQGLLNWVVARAYDVDSGWISGASDDERHKIRAAVARLRIASFGDGQILEWLIALRERHDELREVAHIQKRRITIGDLRLSRVADRLGDLLRKEPKPTPRPLPDDLVRARLGCFEDYQGTSAEEHVAVALSIRQKGLRGERSGRTLARAKLTKSADGRQLRIASTVLQEWRGSDTVGPQDNDLIERIRGAARGVVPWARRKERMRWLLSRLDDVDERQATAMLQAWEDARKAWDTEGPD